MNPPPDYIRKVGELIAKATAAGMICYRAQPDEKSEAETIDKTRRIWAEILYPEVPLKNLEESFTGAASAKFTAGMPERYASFSHKLGAHDVLKQHRDSMHSQKEKNHLLAISGQNRNCLCKGTGEITAYDPKAQEAVTKPCAFHKHGGS